MNFWRLFLFVFTTLFVWGKVHYARIEPYERRVVKSSVSGRVVSAQRELEGSFIEDNRTIVEIDSARDREELGYIEKSLKILREMKRLNDRIVPGLKESFVKKRSYYERMESMSTASKTQKDDAYTMMVNAENQYLAAVEKSLSYDKQILDMSDRADRLRDTIAKKRVAVERGYLYRLDVRRDDYATPGKTLAVVDDIDRAKLVIYLDRDELEGIMGKKVYIDGRESDAMIEKVWRESDGRYISSYRVEIVLKPRRIFSSLVKVELR
jgi:hypothetical protein